MPKEPFKELKDILSNHPLTPLSEEEASCVTQLANKSYKVWKINQIGWIVVAILFLGCFIFLAAAGLASSLIPTSIFLLIVAVGGIRNSSLMEIEGGVDELLIFESVIFFTGTLTSFDKSSPAFCATEEMNFPIKAPRRWYKYLKAKNGENVTMRVAVTNTPYRQLSGYDATIEKGNTAILTPFYLVGLDELSLEKEVKSGINFTRILGEIDIVLGLIITISVMFSCLYLSNISTVEATEVAVYKASFDVPLDLNFSLEEELPEGPVAVNLSNVYVLNSNDKNWHSGDIPNIIGVTKEQAPLVEQARELSSSELAREYYQCRAEARSPSYELDFSNGPPRCGYVFLKITPEIKELLIITEEISEKIITEKHIVVISDETKNQNCIKEDEAYCNGKGTLQPTNIYGVLKKQTSTNKQYNLYTKNNTDFDKLSEKYETVMKRLTIRNWIIACLLFYYGYLCFVYLRTKATDKKMDKIYYS